MPEAEAFSNLKKKEETKFVGATFMDPNFGLQLFYLKMVINVSTSTDKHMCSVV